MIDCSNQFIELSNKDCLFTGARNRVFLHPHDRKCLIKIDYSEERAVTTKRKILNILFFLKRYRMTKYFLREIAQYKRLHLKKESLEMLQEVVGIVETNYGPGLLVLAAVNEQGELASNLEKLMRTRQFDLEMKKELELFCHQLQESSIIVHDLTPANVVYAYHAEYKHHFVIIDGVGEKTFIKIQSLLFFLKKYKKKKQMEKFRKAISDLESRYSLCT